jgi:hypothetical protein
MSEVEAHRQAAVTKLLGDTLYEARGQGHQMGPWRWVPQGNGMWFALTSICETCDADVAIVPHQDPIRVYEAQRRALDWACPNKAPL